MDTSSPLSLPRLRLSRHSPPFRTVNSLTPVASSSRITPETNNHDTADEDEDAEATPRVGSTSITPDPHPQRFSTSSARTSDATARLRALMQSANNTATSRTSATASNQPAPTPPSEPDSDFEPPYSNTTSHSVARESLKELFSFALRDPGDTPRKIKPRRNSIDLSEVEDSPRIELVEKERARNKGKRKSLSDEEAENLSSAYPAASDMSKCSIQIRRILTTVQAFESDLCCCIVRRATGPLGPIYLNATIFSFRAYESRPFSYISRGNF